MTTATSPDGQATTTSTPSNGPPPPTTTTSAPDGEGAGSGDGAIRNWDHVEKVIRERDAAKAKAADLERQIEDLKKKATPAPGPAPTAGQSPADGETAEQKLLRLEAREAQRTLDDRRKAITDVVLERVQPQHKDAVRAMVRLLEEEPGAIDLTSADSNTQGAKALDKLSTRHPAYFLPADGTPQPGNPAAPRRSYEGVEWMQLSPEEQRAVSPEDFAKYFAPGAKGRTAGSIIGGRSRPQPTRK